MEPDDSNDPEGWRRLSSAGVGRGAANRARRKSRVQKQHSYDDEIKTATTPANQMGTSDVGLGKRY